MELKQNPSSIEVVSVGVSFDELGNLIQDWQFQVTVPAGKVEPNAAWIGALNEVSMDFEDEWVDVNPPQTQEEWYLLPEAECPVDDPKVQLNQDGLIVKRLNRNPIPSAAEIVVEGDEPIDVALKLSTKVANAIVREALEVVVKGLDGVEMVLGEGEGARRGSQPPVDDGGLDDVIARTVTPEKGPPLVRGRV